VGNTRCDQEKVLYCTENQTAKGEMEEMGQVGSFRLERIGLEPEREKRTSLKSKRKNNSFVYIQMPPECDQKGKRENRLQVVLLCQGRKFIQRKFWGVFFGGFFWGGFFFLVWVFSTKRQPGKGAQLGNRERQADRDPVSGGGGGGGNRREKDPLG